MTIESDPDGRGGGVSTLHPPGRLPGARPGQERPKPRPETGHGEGGGGRVRVGRDYIVYDSRVSPEAASVIREVIRQRKTELWIGADSRFTNPPCWWGRLRPRIDVGFLGYGITSARRSATGASRRTNGRTGGSPPDPAAARGVPFLPTRDLLGSDTMKVSAGEDDHGSVTGGSGRSFPP